jgi:hypothetical protein
MILSPTAFTTACRPARTIVLIDDDDSLLGTDFIAKFHLIP